MGHALLTQLLMPKLLQTKRERPDADARIVLTSSIGGHIFLPKTGLALDKMKADGSTFNPMTRYGHSKLANQLFAKASTHVRPRSGNSSLIAAMNFSLIPCSRSYFW